MNQDGRNLTFMKNSGCIHGYLSLFCANRKSTMLQEVNGSRLDVQWLQIQLKNPTAMEGVQWNSAMKQLYSRDSRLAKASKGFVGDGIMEKNKGTLKMFRKIPNEELSALERMRFFLFL